jgi:predicted HTH transcriptional regulator
MFQEILAEFPPESETLEYKRKRANKESVVRELVAFANANGGRLIYGVQESDGEIEGFDDFSDDFQSYEEGISNLITSSVQPRISVSIEELEKEGKALMGAFSGIQPISPHLPRRKTVCSEPIWIYDGLP